MGKERDRLIRRLGGVPLSDLDLSDEELMRQRMEYYARQGRLPPEIVALRKRAASAQGQESTGENAGPPDEAEAGRTAGGVGGVEKAGEPPAGKGG